MELRRGKRAVGPEKPNTTCVTQTVIQCVLACVKSMWSPYTKTSRRPLRNTFPLLGRDTPDLGNENYAIVHNGNTILYDVIKYYTLSQSDIIEFAKESPGVFIHLTCNPPLFWECSMLDFSISVQELVHAHEVMLCAYVKEKIEVVAKGTQYETCHRLFFF